jgi:hypothetical protein
VPDCSASSIGFFLVDCSDGTDAAEGTASKTDVDSSADSAADIPMGWPCLNC